MISLQSAMRLGAWKKVVPWKLDQKPVDIEPPAPEPPAPKPKPKFPPLPELVLSPDERDQRRLEAWTMEGKLPPEMLKHITLPTIKNIVCKEWNVTEVEIMSRRNSPLYSIPRQTAYYLAKNHTTESFPKIGRYFGGRDHTTIMHGVRRISELRLTDMKLDTKVAHIQEQLRAMVS